MKFFNILEQTKYMIVTESVDVEECGEEFLTEDEMNEMGLVTYYWKHEQVFKQKITDELLKWKGKVKEGKSSVIVKDEELIEVLKECGNSVSDFVENTRRVGDRVYFNVDKSKKEGTEPKYSDWKDLVELCQYVLDDEYDIKMKVNMTGSNRKNTVDMLKKLVEWSDLEKCQKKYSLFGKVNMKMVKMLFDNSELLIK